MRALTPNLKRSLMIIYNLNKLPKAPLNAALIFFSKKLRVS
jgi:hypothetical protein